MLIVEDQVDLALELEQAALEGAVALAQPAACVPTLKLDVLPRLLPLVPSAQGELRAALAVTLHQAAQALTLHDAAGVGAFGRDVQPAIVLLATEWLVSRSETVREASADAVGSLVAMLPPPLTRELLPQLLPSLLAAQRRAREWERLPLTQALWSLLDHARRCELGREVHSDRKLLPTPLTLP